MSRPLRIGVMGPGSPDPEAEELALETGRLIALRGGILVCGGLGGAMEAASRGASGEGGVVLGILPGSRTGDANPWVSIPVATGVGNARNTINVLTSQAVIAIRGSYGTLSEIALALKCGRPVVALRSWRLDLLGCGDPLFHTADTPAEAVRKAFALIPAED